jgi:hypothetical protein
MKRTITLIILFCLLGIPVALAGSGASGYSFTTILYPGTTWTSVLGINNHGDITGGYRLPSEGDGSLAAHGYTLIHGTFNSVDFPGAVWTHCAAINDRDVTACFYLDSMGNIHSFTVSDGNFTGFAVPGAFDTIAQDINERGEIVGLYDDDAGGHSFVLLDDSFSTLDVPGAMYTEAVGVDARGTVVGDYGDAAGNTHGFVYSNGTFTTVDDPLAVGLTGPMGINARGTIVGWYQGPDALHGFVFADGQFTTVDAPGASETEILRINNRGDLAVNMISGEVVQAFVASAIH